MGHFAIVVVSTPQNKLLATFVLEKEPVRFRHLALGRLEPAPARALSRRVTGPVVGGLPGPRVGGLGGSAHGSAMGRGPAQAWRRRACWRCPLRSARAARSSCRSTSAQVRGSPSSPSAAASSTRWARMSETHAALHNTGSVATLATTPANCWSTSGEIPKAMRTWRKAG